LLPPPRAPKRFEVWFRVLLGLGCSFLQLSKRRDVSAVDYTSEKALVMQCNAAQLRTYFQTCSCPAERIYTPSS
jgi:hypothetical protein